jgi:hypothetical protein
MLPDGFLGLPVDNEASFHWSSEGQFPEVFAVYQLRAHIATLIAVAARDAVGYDGAVAVACICRRGGNKACFECVGAVIKDECVFRRACRRLPRAFGRHIECIQVLHRNLVKHTACDAAIRGAESASHRHFTIFTARPLLLFDLTLTVELKFFGSLSLIILSR